MSNKMKYPMEAFALAMVLFSSGMKGAMLIGVTLIFGDVLLGILQDLCGNKARYAVSAAGAAVTCAALVLMVRSAGIETDTRTILGFAALGILLGKHGADRMKEETENNYGEMLSADACAWLVYVLIAAAREYLAGASVFEYELTKTAVCSAAFGKPMFALIFAGIGTGIVNRILKAESAEHAALWVCLPVLLFETPFVWNFVSEPAGICVGILMTGILYLTFRSRLAFSDTKPHLEGIPAESVLLGMIYMVVTLL